MFPGKQAAQICRREEDMPKVLFPSINKTGTVEISTLSTGSISTSIVTLDSMKARYSVSIGDAINDNTAALKLRPRSDDKSGINILQANSYSAGWSLSAKNDGIFRLFGNDFPSSLLTIAQTTGNTGIGKLPTTYKLDVAGSIRADEIIVNTEGADFVFEENYKLRSLKEVELFIKQNKHLPDIAPASKMQSSGLNVSEMNTRLLQKVEEQTLYIIDLSKQLEELKKQMLELKK